MWGCRADGILVPHTAEGLLGTKLCSGHQSPGKQGKVCGLGLRRASGQGGVTYDDGLARGMKEGKFLEHAF